MVAFKLNMRANQYRKSLDGTSKNLEIVEVVEDLELE